MNKKTLTISEQNHQEEHEVFESIKKCIDSKSSFVFDAGAGAGKTYALIETLKYIIQSCGMILKTHNQKILCITYTNVAAIEIKERLGNNSVVKVSTIHECVWDIIRPYQEQLVGIHQSKIKAELQKSNDALQNEEWAKKFRNLEDDNQNKFADFMLEQQANYYEVKNLGSKSFNDKFSDIPENYKSLLSNVANFKKITDALLRIHRYGDALTKIMNKEPKFCAVDYDARLNSDRLHAMKISHDTVLEYTEQIVRENELLKQIICNQYPFILVDEYQDTDVKVIEALSYINEHALKQSYDFIVGYYGDIKQHIYEKGVGSNLDSKHKDLERVITEFNRRSANGIIDIANSIRNDFLKQKSIYENFPLANISFYNMSINRETFLKYHKKKWNISRENPLHCFELTNENVAEQSGFSAIYGFFKESPWYKVPHRYKLLRDHIIPTDNKKLGEVQNLMFRILDFKYKMKFGDTMISSVFSNKNVKHLNINELRALTQTFQNITGNSLREYVINLFSKYKSGDKVYDKCLAHIMIEDISSYMDLENFIYNQLYSLNNQSENKTDDDDNIQENKKAIENFLSYDIHLFETWHHFLIDNNENDTIFHTYHGTKGKEFENVIIFMNSKVYKNPNYFSDLLKSFGKQLSEEESSKISEAQNLLYVAVTRAIKNLSILYFDEIDEFKEQIETVFGAVRQGLDE